MATAPKYTEVDCPAQGIRTESTRIGTGCSVPSIEKSDLFTRDATMATLLIT